MAELRLQVSDDLLKQFQDKLGPNMKPSEIARDAFSLYNWALNERAKGRVVLSSEESGKDVTRITTPALDRVKTAS